MVSTSDDVLPPPLSPRVGDEHPAVYLTPSVRSPNNCVSPRVEIVTN